MILSLQNYIFIWEIRQLLKSIYSPLSEAENEEMTNPKAISQAYDEICRERGI